MNAISNFIASSETYPNGVVHRSPGLRALANYPGLGFATKTLPQRGYTIFRWARGKPLQGKVAYWGVTQGNSPGLATLGYGVKPRWGKASWFGLGMEGKH